MPINAYDFDGTIYDGDSTFHFYRHCLAKYPSIITELPGTGAKFLAFGAKQVSKTQFKERMYRFVRHVPDMEAEVRTFWDKNESRIKDWYKKQHRDNDIIISASPTFLLTDICCRLGIGTLIASEIDPKTGRALGENCHGAEKVRRLKMVMPDVQIDEFYSDSESDTPLACFSAKSFMVKGDVITPWPGK